MRGTPTGPTNTDVDANTTHRTSDGSDHTFINQSVTTSASPTFNGVTSTAATTTTVSTTATSNVGAAATFVRETSGNMVDNFGVQILFGIEDATSGLQTIGKIVAKRDGGDSEGTLTFRAGTNGGEAFMTMDASANKVVISKNTDINGSLSKSSGSFKIDHPLPEMSDTHHLYHSFVEGPRADNIYRGVVTLVAGTATVNLDEVSCMTEGTFVALNKNVQTFTTNEQTWDNVRGSVSGNILTIECEDTASTIDVSWLVIGERQDAAIMNAPWIDTEGRNCIEQPKSGGA